MRLPGVGGVAQGLWTGSLWLGPHAGLGETYENVLIDALQFTDSEEEEARRHSTTSRVVGI